MEILGKIEGIHSRRKFVEKGDKPKKCKGGGRRV